MYIHIHITFLYLEIIISNCLGYSNTYKIQYYTVDMKSGAFILYLIVFKNKFKNMSLLNFNNNNKISSDAKVKLIVLLVFTQ